MAIITLSQIPLEATAAAAMLNDIKRQVVDVHPDQKRQIIERLEQVVAGTYISPAISEKLTTVFQSEDYINIRQSMKRLNFADIEVELSKFLSAFCDGEVQVRVEDFHLNMPTSESCYQTHKLSLELTVNPVYDSSKEPF